MDANQTRKSMSAGDLAKVRVLSKSFLNTVSLDRVKQGLKKKQELSQVDITAVFADVRALFAKEFDLPLVVAAPFRNVGKKVNILKNQDTRGVSILIDVYMKFVDSINALLK